MQFLLTNDDGVDAPGLRALHDSLLDFLTQIDPNQESKVFVVAPDRGRSECGHSVTTTEDLYVQQNVDGWYGVNGTPVDCVRVALHAICPQVDAVFSGINAGANVGVDLLVSGTFAAAREASLMGRPAMAISHYRRPEIAKTWQHCPRWLHDVFGDFWTKAGLATSTDKSQCGDHGTLWNVNLPAIVLDGGLPLRVRCPVERQPMERRGKLEPCQGDPPRQLVAMQSDFHGRPKKPGTDVDVCFGGRISISEISPIW